jgi:hypothetical protein
MEEEGINQYTIKNAINLTFKNIIDQLRIPLFFASKEVALSVLELSE